MYAISSPQSLGGLNSSSCCSIRGRVKEPGGARRRKALRRVDWELEKGNYKAALALIRHLQGNRDGLRGFGTAKLVPKRVPVVDESSIAALLPIADSILRWIKCSLEFASSDQEDEEEVLSLGIETLAVESYGSSSEDHLMCAQHEAGHFLVGYLVGVLPKRYWIPSVEAVIRDKSVRGKVEFPGFEFLAVVDAAKAVGNVNKPKLNNKGNQGNISSTILDRFLCVILGGLTAEYLEFGYPELLHSDVEKLDRVLKWVGFAENEAESKVRWAATNTVVMLNHHKEARSRLAEAMAAGKSVGFCIDTIESNLNEKAM